MPSYSIPCVGGGEAAIEELRRWSLLDCSWEGERVPCCTWLCVLCEEGVVWLWLVAAGVCVSGSACVEVLHSANLNAS